jgi:streptogramin lyase
MTAPGLNRRGFLQFAAMGIGAVSAGVMAPPAFAAPGSTLVDVTDLGPATNMFSLAAAVNIGDVVYVASRNIDPMVVVGYNLATRKVVSVTEVPGSISTQALTASIDGRHVYVGIDGRPAGSPPNLLRIDVSASDAPLAEVATFAGFNALHVTTAPDGMIFLVGQPGGDVHEFDPSTGATRLLANPEPTAQWGRTVAATESTVYVGYRGQGPGGTGSAAKLYAIDRATGAATSILPPEFAAAPELRDLSIDGDTLIAVGLTAGGVGVALIDIVDPTDYTIASTPGKLAKLPVSHAGKIYFAGDGLTEYDPAAGSFRSIKLPAGQFGEMWDLFERDDRMVVTSGFGLIFEIDPATSETTQHDLIAAGAPAGAQLAMSVTASKDYVYVGGNNVIARHDLRTGELVNLFAPGEAKDAAIIDDVFFSGQYSGVGIVRYDPRTDGQWPAIVAGLPSAQNRPQDVHWDPQARRLLVGSQSDTAGGGAYLQFDPATQQLTTEVTDPFGDGQYIRQLTSCDGVTYLGGQQAKGQGGTIVAWDQTRHEELWRLSPPSLSRGITGLAVHGRHLFAMAYAGRFVVIDLVTRSVIHEAQHSSLVPDMNTLLVHRGQVYGVSSETFYRFDRKTFALEELVTGLGGEWYGMPRVSVDSKGRFYGIRGRNLIRIDVK